MTDTPTTEVHAPAVAEPHEPPQRGTPTRRILAALFWLLSSLAILVGSVTLWANQTLLTSDGWATVVSGVASDREAIDATSAKLVGRLADSLGVEEKIANILPSDGNLLAGAITSMVEDQVSRGVADLAESERVQEAFVEVNRVAHDAAMKVIRGGDSEALTSEGGAITLNVMPLLEGALVGLQDAGFIDDSREIPDLSTYEPPAQTVSRLETLLGRDLPDDIGTITLVESERLDRVQTGVRAFDIITVLLVLLVLACSALALWLSARRIRMVLWLAVGAIGALLLGRGFTRVVMNDITGALRDGEGRVMIQAAIESALDSLLWFTFVMMVVALIVAGLAIWIERRDALAAGAIEPDEPQNAREWLRSRAWAIGYIGIGLVAFAVLWRIAVPDVTFLAAAGVGVVLIGVNLLARRDPGSPQGSTAPGSEDG